MPLIFSPARGTGSLALKSFIRGPTGPPGAGTTLYDTRTDAAAATIDSMANFVQTEGYTTVGDDGGALYIRTTLSTVGGFQSADGQWWKLATQSLNVKMLGAKGDGTTDDSSAIQTAISAIAAGGSLFIPSGTYKITSALTLATTGGIKYKLYGAGPSSIISVAGNVVGLHVTGSAGVTLANTKISDFAIIAASGTSPALIQLDGIAGFSVEDMHLNLNNHATYGIQCIGSQQGEFRGGMIRGDGGISIHLGLSSGSIASNGIDIHGISFLNGNTGVEISGVDSCFIHSNHFVSFQVAVDIILSSFGVTIIDGNHIELCSVAGIRVDNGGVARIISNIFFIVGVPDVNLVASAGSIISNNLMQGGITVGAASVLTVITHNVILGTFVMADSGDRTLFHMNSGAGAGGALANYLISDSFTFRTSAFAGQTIATFLSNPIVAGDWGISVVGAGANKDVYIQLHDITLNGNTAAAGTFTVKNGIAGTTLFSADGTGNITAPATVRPTAIPFASLPTGGSLHTGQIACVNNSSVNGWGNTADGAGALTVLAWYNGTAWKVIGQ